MGKTSSCLHALNQLSLLEDVFPALILAPLRVALGVWPSEVEKWDNFTNLKVSAIVGSASERKNALMTKADIYTVNYENIPWMLEQENYPDFKTIVADESTKLKSFRLRQGGSRARALSKIAHKVNRFIELTGTPSPNGLMDLWGQMWFIDQGAALGKTFTAFRDRWFKAINCGAFTKFTPHDYAQKEIEARIKKYTISLKAEDWFELDKLIVNDVPAYLPTKAMAQYKEFEKEMFVAFTKTTEVEAMNAAAKTMKCLQMANGAVYTDENKNWHAVHNAKIEALESIINETSSPVIVAYHFKSDLERLIKAFPQGVVLGKDTKIIDKWNKGKIPILFAHPASAGHGLNLQDGGNVIIFFSHWWNLEEYQQIVERIGPTRQAQSGHKRPVFVYNICAVGTIDELVIQSRTDKRTVQDLLLEAAKRS